MKFTETTKREVEYDVTFPLYSKHDLMSDYHDSVIYTRIDEDMTKYSIHITTSYDADEPKTYELEIEHNFRPDASSPDYYLGKGDYKSSVDEFNEAHKQLLQAVLDMKVR